MVGAGQCLLIAWGIKVMRDGNASRDANLKALETQGRALETQGKALETQGKALADIGAGIAGTLATVRLLAGSLGVWSVQVRPPAENKAEFWNRPPVKCIEDFPSVTLLRCVTNHLVYKKVKRYSPLMRPTGRSPFHSFVSRQQSTSSPSSPTLVRLRPARYSLGRTADR